MVIFFRPSFFIDTYKVTFYNKFMIKSWRHKGLKDFFETGSKNGNWRVTFYFENQDAILVDYIDYH